MLWGLGVAGIKRWRIDDQTANLVERNANGRDVSIRCFLAAFFPIPSQENLAKCLFASDLECRIL